MPPHERPSFSVQQVADLFGVNESSVHRWLSRDLLPSWLDEHGRRRVDAVAVFRLLYPKP